MKKKTRRPTPPCFSIQDLDLGKMVLKNYAMLLCKDIQDSTTSSSYLLADLSVPCYTTAWYNTAYISIALIPIYPLGIPALFLYLMYKHRALLHHDPRIQAQFGFLYLG